MTPSPYIQLLPQANVQLDRQRSPCAALLIETGQVIKTGQAIPSLQTQADALDLALILPETAQQSCSDGVWTDHANALKAVRKQSAAWQLVGLAQDRHSAMMLGEAGADLILFGRLRPLIVPGDLALACWWASLFEIPCGLVLDAPPGSDMAFGTEGWPEFYALEA